MGLGESEARMVVCFWNQSTGSNLAQNRPLIDVFGVFVYPDVEAHGFLFNESFSP